MRPRKEIPLIEPSLGESAEIDHGEENPYRPLEGTGSRETKFASLCGYMTLRGLFQLMGRTVGAYPWAYITVATILSLNSCGMYKMVLKDRIRDGYTPINAPSRYETDAIREFWNSSGDPMMAILLFIAKDGGSMHRKEHLDETERLYNYLNNNFSVTHAGKRWRFFEMCEPYCNINKVFEMFKEAFDKQYSRVTDGQNASQTTDLLFPVADINGYEVHLERSFFGVKSRPQSGGKVAGKGIETVITNMDHVQVILMLMRGDKSTRVQEELLAKWEVAAYDFALSDNSSLVEVQVVGTEILDNEMIRDGRRMTPFFAAGFGFMISFVSICVFFSAVYYDELDVGKILCAIGATLCPILAITSTYGIVSLLGFHVNSFMLVMPFLIMGIGVDDSFLMIHSWQRMSRCGYTVMQRLGMVYEEVGPSITITSLTNFLSFGIGALTPTPEIRMFCFATAMATGLDYIFQLLLFGPVLALASHCEKPRETKGKSHTGWRLKVEKCSEHVLKLYCKLLNNRLFNILIIGATVCYWYFGIIGLMNIQTRLDAVKILPKNSPLQKPNHLLSNIVWAEYHPVTILINSPLDLNNQTQMHRFWKLVNEFEALHHSKGPASSLIWLRDYYRYYHYGEPYDIMSLLFGVKAQKKEDPIDPFVANVTYSKLDTFLKSPFYKHWEQFMKIANTSNGPVVTCFWMTVAYCNTSSWETRIGLMEDWRALSYRYKDLNATVWEPNGMFVDQMLSLKSVALQTGVLTLLCMAVVCAIFIPNPCSVITASIAIASISLGVLGFLSWWHFDLDPVVMAAVLMSIGMSVDFTAHVSYHYQEIVDGKIVKVRVNGAQEKLEHTLQAVGWPMIQAGVSTVVCILPLLFLQSYSPSVFVATIFLVVCWGVLHGLLVLPAFLCCLPDCLTNVNCYRIFFSTSSEKSCRLPGIPIKKSQSHQKSNDKLNGCHQKLNEEYEGQEDAELENIADIKNFVGGDLNELTDDKMKAFIKVKCQKDDVLDDGCKELFESNKVSFIDEVKAGLSPTDICRNRNCTYTK
ncbi:unnamed protein product, partial [Mesorhabditis belari]|uniref:SSD domain-containing protein n=1 Tax=Mesorhabditis belari TaxID=2138241 RepID=A0AAF3ERK1_9BILA